MTDRLQTTLSNLKPRESIGVFPYITVGYPTIEDTVDIVSALANAGATAIELGIPFSDPIADGPTIQASCFHALKQGVTLKICLDVCRSIRQNGVEIPLIFMGYYNPILSYGIDNFAKDAAEVGADGVIVPDLPPEESGPLLKELQLQQLSLITMVAPTSTDERIALACSQSDAFIYCVSVAGVTGARRDITKGLFEFLDRVRSHTNLPLAVGFGISTREHVTTVGSQAEAVIVGSKLIDVLDSAKPSQRAHDAGMFLANLTGKDIKPLGREGDQ